MQVYINNFNLLTWPKMMAEYIADVFHAEPIIIDNASTYQPLLEWYNNCPVTVLRLGRNMGHKAPWDSGIMHPNDEYYAVTDPDLDLSGIPADGLDYLKDRLASQPQLTKVGFGLNIADEFPDVNRAYVLETEAPYNCYRDGEFFVAPIDTTFAVYSTIRGLANGWFTAHRSMHPYTCKHNPWYVTPANMSDEFNYYLTYANKSSTVRDRMRPIKEL